MREYINIAASCLGAVKQIPFLLKEMNEIDASFSVNVLVENYSGADYIDKILKSDLRYENLNANNLNVFEYWKGKKSYPSPLATIGLAISGNRLVGFREKTIELYVDPLKFEKRRLLTCDEINSLKKKYFLNSDNIILGGSLDAAECSHLFGISNEIFSEKPESQIIFVPRENPGGLIDNIELLGKNYCTDKNPKKSSKILVITEKGILDKLYSVCDIAIVGNSFWKGGGQNPLEPAFYGKYILSGKHNVHNSEAYNGLEKSGLLKRINSYQLQNSLLRKPSEEKLKKCKRTAERFIDFNRGAAKVYAEIIFQMIEEKFKDSSEIEEKLNSLNFYHQDKFDFYAD